MSDDELTKDECHDEKSSAEKDTARLDWLERNLLNIVHDNATCSVDMRGNRVTAHLENEARGDRGGPPRIRLRAPSIRAAIDSAMEWSPETYQPFPK